VQSNLLIYITSLFTGMSIMAVELSATRLLAPYFGASQIIWTVVIGLIMIALSIGNMLGGRLADRSARNPDHGRSRLYSLIWVAALWITLIPLVGKYVIALLVAVLMWVFPGNLILAGSIFSSLIIFSFPLVILGMVSPFLVKLGVVDMETNGKVTGEIYGLSTIGSIIGTFIPTFVTIPSGLGTSKTFYVFALILNLIALFYFLTVKKRVIRTAVSALIILILIFLPLKTSYAFWKPNVIEDESVYNYLQVAMDDETVIFTTNVAFGVQSVYRKDHPLTGYYYDYLLSGPFFLKDTDRQSKFSVLVLGLGAGTFPKQCKYFFPASRIEGVEIDGKVIALAKEYFDLTEEEVTVHINDGRTFLQGKDAGMYDLILIDAYHDITIPFHMTTKEFYTLVKARLKADGVLVLNINMHSTDDPTLIDYLTQTVKAVMEKVYRCDLGFSTNSLVFASENRECLEAYQKNIRRIPPGHRLYPIARYVAANLTEITQADLVLTDEVAPVEVMGHGVLDELVRVNVDAYRRQIKSAGSLRQLIDLLN
jgi:spermidine synthase